MHLTQQKLEILSSTQCLASWFSCQENSWIFEIYCQDFGNYSWPGTQGLQNFSRSCKQIKENFWTSWQKLPRISKILAREARNSCIKLIQDYKYLKSNNPWKLKRGGYSCVWIYRKLNVAWPVKKGIKINWHKLETKIKHTGIIVCAQTSYIDCQKIRSNKKLQLPNSSFPKSTIYSSASCVQELIRPRFLPLIPPRIACRSK